MSRVNFITVIALPVGPGGSLVPVEGISATPYSVNSDQSEGAQVGAYTSRTSQVEASLITDANGMINYWIESGDYNIHIADQQTPPRIQSYVQGFDAAQPDSTSSNPTSGGGGSGGVTQSSSDAYPGDMKFSMQSGDHGENADGTFQWLIMVPVTQTGGGRVLSSTDYSDLWNTIGRPATDAQGNFTLVNVAGTTLVVAGSAPNPFFSGGLTPRAVMSQFGEERHLLVSAELAAHTHTISSARTGVLVTNAASQTNVVVEPSDLGFTFPEALNGTLSTQSLSAVANNGPYPFPYSAGGFAPLDPSHTHLIADPAHTHVAAVQDPGHTHTATSTATGSSHNNMQPSTAFNLFIHS